jgi:hypothetical protein
MRFAAIEFNDTAVALARDDALLTQSPGYALIERETLLMGEPALRQARLKPRLVSTRFWDRLSNEPVFPAAPTGTSFADLARTHLSQVWTRAGQDVGGLILAVPGSFERRQLGLLLGIAEQLALPVCGMVDSALVACSPHAQEGLFVHVDIHLHRAVVTGIEVNDDARRVFHHSLEEHGLIQFHDRWVRLIADLFVQTTRFDPLHRAQSEQAIYDGLPLWLAALEVQDSTGVEMAARDGSVHAIRLTRTQVAECARELYVRLGTAIAELCGNRALVLQLAAGAARLPGLADALQSVTSGTAASLPSGAGALGALRHALQITDGGWRNTLTVSLPRNVFARNEEAENNP